MPTAATPLLAGFNFDFTPSLYTPEVPSTSSPPLTRPSTPDPRHPFRPQVQRCHPQQHQHFPRTRDAPKRVRRKPPALHLGNQSRQVEATPWSISSDGIPPFIQSIPPRATLQPMLPCPPSTPSPRYAHAAPSLSSSATTAQSSPTLTPTGESPQLRSEQQQRYERSQEAERWNRERKSGLRRAKRLPHREQGLWEVHAIVHVGGSGEQQGQQQQEVYEQRICEQQNLPQSDYGFRQPFRPANPETITEPVAQDSHHDSNLQNKDCTDFLARRPGRAVRFLGISSESASREGSLRRVQEADTSTFSLSKYQFPPPPAPWHSPTTVHYRGASFDLVNPHASLLLGPSNFETPAEIDGLLDDYFEHNSMPRQLYGDAESARRNILRLGGDAAADSPPSIPPSAASGSEGAVPSPSPSETARSEPFPLYVSDEEEGEASRKSSDDESALGSTVAGIIADYDYTRDAALAPPPASDEATLRALEEGIGPGEGGHASSTSSWRGSAMAARVAAAFAPQPAQPDFTLPSTSRTYGDTNQLLNIPARESSAAIRPHPEFDEAWTAQMRPAPSRSTMQRDSDVGMRSTQVSLHNGSSEESLPPQRSSGPVIPSMWSAYDFPEQRRGRLEQHGLVEPSFGALGRRTTIYDAADDGEGWETDIEPSQSYQDLHGPFSRPSEESYANTSHYSGNNRLSAMTDAANADIAESAQPEAATPLAGTDSTTDGPANSTDIKRVYKYINEQFRKKVANQDLEQAGMPSKTSRPRHPADRHRFDYERLRKDVADQDITQGLLCGVPSKTSHSQRHADRHRLQRFRNQVKEDKDNERDITNDAELEQLRRKNPVAVKIAVEKAADSIRRHTHAARAGFGRVRGLIRQSTSDPASENGAIMAEALAGEDGRGLISAAQSDQITGRSSELAYSETDHTFRTVRGSGSIIAGLPGSQFDSPYDAGRPIVTPPTAMTIGARGGNPRARPVQPGDRPGASENAKGKRRAAMSGQTTLRPFEISGSPTSNIQGAFTDRELIEKEPFWRTRPPPAHRADNTSGAVPTIAMPTSHPGDEGRLLVRPDEVLSEHDSNLQTQLSKQYLLYCLPFPPALAMYASGRLDYRIANHTKGKVTCFSKEKKDAAARWAIVGSLGYLLIIVMIIIVVKVAIRPEH